MQENTLHIPAFCSLQSQPESPGYMVTILFFVIKLKLTMQENM